MKVPADHSPQANQPQTSAVRVAQPLSSDSVQNEPLTFDDRRPEAVAQRKLTEAIHHSLRQVAQRKIINAIHQSPQILAQRKQLEAMFRKTPLVQRSPEEDELQRQANLEFNRTGLPDQLKVGIESLSGIDLSDVRVHANSEKPAQLNALAYTQGTDIHVGPGQEPSLPHEAWHVVQQKQGRVKPTIQTKGVSINDDEDFEHEADVMGAKAAAYQAITPIESDPTPSVSGAGSRHLVVQRERDKAHETNTLNMIYDALKENMPDNEDENTREGEVSQIAYVHFGNTAKEEYFATDIEGQIRDSDYLTPQGMGEKPGHNQQTQEEWERAIRGTTYTEGGNYFWIRNTEYEQEGGKPDERIILNLKSQHDAAAIIAHI